MAGDPKRQAEPERPELSPEEKLDREDWLRLSALGLEEAYGEDEPEYSLNLIKEPNPEWLRNQINLGLEQARRGEFLDGEEVFRSLAERDED